MRRLDEPGPVGTGDPLGRAQETDGREPGGGATRAACDRRCDPMTTTATEVDPATVAPPVGNRWGFAHLPALDGLRGAAVVAVLLYHGGHLEGGYLGVDLFFALSGFLITSLLLSEYAATGAISLRMFWARRARRLLPAVLLLVAAIALYTRVIARPVDYDMIRADGLATLAYVANWHTILGGGSYWKANLAPSPFQHTWSLAIEEQFYLLWPLVVVAVIRRRPRSVDRTVGVLAGVCAVLAALWFVGLHALGATSTRVYQGTDTRAGALLGGAALAAWCRLRPPDPERPGRERMLGRAAVVATLVLGAMWLWLPGTSAWLYRGGLPLASGLALLLVAAVARRAPGPLTPLLSVRWLRWLGLISYGLYLWHWPIFQALKQRNGDLPLLGDVVLGDGALFALQVGLSLLAAVISYRLVEQPIRRGALPPRLAGPAAVAGLALAAVVIAVATVGGITLAGQKHDFGTAAEYVPRGPQVLFVGDSVAQSLVLNPIEDPFAFGINPVNRTYPGCLPVGQGREVQNFSQEAFDPAPCFRRLATELPEMNPDAVVLNVGSRPNERLLIGGEWVTACDPAYAGAYRTAMADLVRRLRSSGAPVAVVTVARVGENSVAVDEGSDERIACVNRQLEKVAADVDGASLIDVNDFVCPDQEGCIERLDGDDVRPDGIHFSDGPAGDQVSAWIIGEALDQAGLEPAPGTPKRR
jgi:peptidoglycan/LPS O-acetylase OafA/YrhL